MKAAVYHRNGPPDVLQYEDVPDPVVAPGGVVIQVEAVSIEGGDTLNRLAGPLFSDPHIVGYQAAGTIVAVGDDVTDRAVGDRVVATNSHGSHAELWAVSARTTWKIPEGADATAVACVPIPFGTAHDCLFEFGRLKEGETVLIQAGAGGVGVAAIQLAKRAGATVIATASSLARLEPLAELGLDHAVDYSTSGWVEEVRSLGGGRGVDLVVDSVGGSTLQQSVACLGRRGRAITVGNAGRDMTPFNAGVLGRQNQSLTGVYLGGEITTPRVQTMVQDLVDDVAAGRLTVLVDRTFPLAEAAAAHEYIESRRAIGRVVLTPTAVPPDLA
ncbi:quinone oxidoreductase family protein [Blastococcus goldschmidtiae]|uniref:Zinc-binding alcohol dehydrogenase family protein n=1 Tax=Blastococcus goldschmidtiae TaxID=3075546 RepID=A0ABU2K8M2_9ACTN|nr:zinc-binding alcohol dehydrogenase family protein [Blastococcus sp. DSM 46792]MDT0276540.1 zinc-binding alcohol dehydrogenase family protein [Blastococcus sp. DSM 46792]